MDSRHWTENLDLLIEACPPEATSFERQNDASHANKADIKQCQADGSLSAAHTLLTLQPDAPYNYSTGGLSKAFAVSPSLQASPRSSTNNNTIFSASAFDLPPLNSPRGESEMPKNHEARPQWTEPAVGSFYTDSNSFDASLDLSIGASPTVDESKITRYLEILSHSSSCFDRRCPVQECFKMRAFIGHVNNCPRAGNGCRLCRRFFLLSRLHSTTCSKPIGHCPVLFCSHFKLEAANA